VLRRFIEELAAKLTYAGVGKLAGTSKETVRKFVERQTGDLRRSTERKFQELFRMHNPGGVSAFVKEHTAAPALPQFRDVLPDGLEAATAELRKIFELARRHPGELPPSAARVEAALLRHLHAEYEVAVATYPHVRQRAPKRRRQ
jgi:hypothetical protein